MDATKIDDNTIEITKQPAAPDPIVSKYDYDFLVHQRAAIIKQANEYIDQRQTELDEVDALLAECVRLGIKSKEMPPKLV